MDRQTGGRMESLKLGDGTCMLVMISLLLHMLGIVQTMTCGTELLPLHLLEQGETQEERGPEL